MHIFNTNKMICYSNTCEIILYGDLMCKINYSRCSAVVEGSTALKIHSALAPTAA